METSKAVTVTVETDHLNAECIVGDREITFYGWQNMAWMDSQTISFETAKQLIKQLNAVMKAHDAEEKKL